MKKIAIIGAGISGLVSARILYKKYEIDIFESNNYIGGHTHTIDVSVENESIPVDTGFIVFNQKSYPLFTRLINKLGVSIQKSEMSFSYRSDRDNIEYNGHNLNTLFSDRGNLKRKNFYQFIGEILRFNWNTKRFLQTDYDKSLTIKDFVQKNRYTNEFVKWYLIPLVSSIWSKNENNVMSCSAHFIFKFFEKNGLLDLVGRPAWWVLKNGSRSYIDPLTTGFQNRIHLNQRITSISRSQSKVVLCTAEGEKEFDGVVIATHSNEALQMLREPSSEETAILSAIPYTKNSVILHTDARVMPKNRLAWASWNYIQIHSLREGNNTINEENSGSTLTYYMNRLQGLKCSQDFFVSVNLEDYIAPEKIVKKFHYAHPCLRIESVEAQKKHQLINGKNNTYYAGSYWGYGFHEDGVQSALYACQPLEGDCL